MAEDQRQDVEMSFWDHLDELRGTLYHSIVAVCIASCLGFIFKDLLFDIILAPTKPDYVVYRVLHWDFGMNLINVEVSAQFFVHLKAALSAGLVISFPYIIWEIWKFVVPALYENEKKALKGAFLMASGLFYLGVVVGYYFVLPVCLQFFMGYTVSDDILNTITLSSYMSMFMSMVLVIGLVFEFPTVIAAISRMGIVGREQLRKGRKYALVAVMVLSAIVTPSDPFSMIVLSLPLYLLYEFSILICKDKFEDDSEEE